MASYTRKTDGAFRENKRETDGYRHLMLGARMSADPGDAFGWSMGTLGDLADAAYMIDGTVLPGYRPSIMHEPAVIMEGEEYEQARQLVTDWACDIITMEDIQRVQTIIRRYVRWVELAGRDY